MARILRTVALAFLSCLLAQLAYAQTAVVTRNVNLRRDSSDELASMRLLKPGVRLTILNTEPEDDYYFVRTPEGQEGWVWSRNIRLEDADRALKPLGIVVPAAAPANAFAKNWSRPEPKGGTFTGSSGKCPFAGIGDEIETNQRKNRTDVPTGYHDVTFKTVANLPYPKAPKERSDWSDDQLDIIRPFEGVAVRVVGFLVAIRPQTGSAERTNCRFTKAVETDWHMALVERAGQGEEEALVIETTPRVRARHQQWTVARVKQWVDSDSPVRISGWTFLDPEHRNHLNRYRSTLWEIHPITKIEVFQNDRWVDLDNLP